MNIITRNYIGYSELNNFKTVRYIIMIIDDISIETKIKYFFSISNENLSFFFF